MIRVGIGGWTFAPWRETFYPPAVKPKDELKWASRQLTSIEINGTFYRSMTEASFRKWREETPDGFVFAVKGHRGVTNRRTLHDAGEAIDWFLKTGIEALGDRLGPINWQLMPTKRFDPAEIAGFFGLLPKEHGGLPLRHAIEARHESFVAAEFVDLARKFNVAVIYADAKYPQIADPTADFIYARLQGAAAEIETGYAPEALDAWAARAAAWAAGGTPADLTLLGSKPANEARDVFVYFINGAKERAPRAALELIERTGVRAK